ncbi:cell morphogenesis N-terminal-domain-containing protein [Boletus edulis]|nr:cell morphogenesis N-terminal-domain-containing protein [Boletus edulis]
MGSEGLQITIPDFDEDDFQTTPVPFGRAGAFGFGSVSGPESPIILTPTTAVAAERSFFSAHTRGDSLASDDSFLDHAPRRPFAHVSQSSVATTSTSTSTGTGPSVFSKKASFASIRNAFKSTLKSNADVPPLPSLDHHQVYPILKNPFNRSTSSLATSKQNNATSPPHQHPRPPTPSESRPSRSTSRPRGHSTVRSHHSHSGSVFFGSENGSDHGHGYPFGHNPNHAFSFGHPPNSPPPVPRVPESLVVPRSESPIISEDESEEHASSKSPADYALHARQRLTRSVRESPDSDPILTDFFGPSLDPQFDELLHSLGKIAQKRAKNVIDAIMRWRRGIRGSPANRSGHPRMAERGSLAAIYVMCRALVAVLSMLPANALSDTMGHSLEETIFEQFRRPLQSVNHNYKLCAELYAGVLGCLASLRFPSVTDRFLNELAPVAHGQIAKDLDTKFENLVKGLRYVQIKVWPPEAFEEGAEFMESLAKSFENAHGLRFKVAFAETLTRLLHPIGKAAQAEVNHPQWEKAIEKIYPRAKEMMSKPRYWHVAYPLAATALCVAPHHKLKDKPYRIPILNGTVRLIWTYLYRCQESSSTSTSKLDGLLKHFFPTGRSSVFPPEEHLEPFICIVHFILSRHFEYGRDFCMELLQESTSANGALAPERVGILVQATLLTLHGIEREEPTPTWPSSADFSTIPSWDDYPSSSDVLPASVLSKPGIQDFVDRFGAATSTIAQACFKVVGHMSVFDEQWSLARSSASGSASSFEESHNLVIRRHPEGAFAYPNHLVSHISILQTCYQSWPRCLYTSSTSLVDAVDMLLRGVVHVEPRVGEVAGAALRRFMKDAIYAPTVLKCFTAFLFDPKNVEREGTGHRILLESARLLNLWTGVVDTWITGLSQKAKQDLAANDLLVSLQQAEEVALGSLFLLSYEVMAIRCVGVKLMRSLIPLCKDLIPEGTSVNNNHPFSFLFSSLFENDPKECPLLQGFDELLDRAELDRLQQWRRSAKPDVLLRIADSNIEKDRKIWRFIYPVFMRTSLSSCGKLIPNCRAVVEAATTRYHPTMLRLAGISYSGSRNQSSRPTERDGFKLVKENMSLIDQWYVWTRILCSTAAVSDNRLAMTQAGREHTRAPSGTNFERERMSTTRCLFKHLTPFLDADYTPFRDAAVLSISSFPLEGYPQLLEDLNLFASRQFYDEGRTKPGSTGIRSRRQARLHSAVGRIYYLTAPHLHSLKSSSKQDALAHALKFVRNTQAFLLAPDNRDSYSLQRLRRYFCGLVERLFDDSEDLPEVDGIHPNIHLSIYRMCEEWCQYGPQSESAKTRFILMQRAAAAAIKDPGAESDAGERFQHETKLLSHASVGALSSLCQKAYRLVDGVDSNSPIERPTPDPHKLLEATQILDRIHAVFEDAQAPLVACAKKALGSLLTLPQPGADLLADVLRRGFCDATTISLSSSAFFETIVDVICNASAHSFTFAQVVCLGLANLCHGDITIRQHAFNTLVIIHQQSAGVIAITELETMVANRTPSVYLQAHRLVGECLAGEHPEKAFDVLTEVTALLLRVHRLGNERVCHLMLQGLEHWMPSLEITAPDTSKLALTSKGSLVVYHLLALTKRFGNAQPEQVAAIWARLVEVPDPLVGRTVASFLVNESIKVATNAFVKCASEVIACLSRSAAGVQIFQELCSVCGPERMLPTFEHRLEQPSPDELELWSDLDVLFADDQPRQLLGSAQYAMVYIGSVSLERMWTNLEQIPVILLAVLCHLDHRVLMLRSSARRMLFHLMRACVPRYPSATDKAGQPARTSLLSIIAIMEDKGDSLFWLESDAEEVVMPRLKYIVDQVVSVIGQSVPDLAKNLAAMSIPYVEHCHIRSIAKRSLQVFRLLKVPLSQDVLGHILSRLCTIISDDETELHHFSEAIISTLVVSVASDDLNPTLLPRLFWATASCLMTAVESEFAAAVKLLTVLLAKLDFDNPESVESVLAQRPESWNGMESLHSCLLSGLRSATTMGDTFAALRWLTRVTDSRLIEPSECRVCDLFALSLPWCLHAMSSDSRDATLDDFCTSIAKLASQDGRDTISRIMTSFVKNRFRTKDDFLRQSIAGLREYYSTTRWSDITTLLLGLVLNKEHWVRIHTMQVLKAFFQQRDSRNAHHSLATEHLMPLLRLVEGELAAEALDVLEEPTKVSGGQNSRNVLRMSMHGSFNAAPVDEGEIFGVPEDSGWCIPRVKSRRSICRNNMMAVAQVCIGALRPSYIDLESRSQIISFSDPLDEDLGVLVQDLHELSEFFQNTKPRPRILVPSQQLEERVASIIARSTETSNDAPQTPFTDVFHIGKPDDYSDDSGDDSGSDSELDAFIYDSPTLYQSAPNGRGLNF